MRFMVDEYHPITTSTVVNIHLDGPANAEPSGTYNRFN
jgi:hypothetical protein